MCDQNVDFHLWYPDAFRLDFESIKIPVENVCILLKFVVKWTLFGKVRKKIHDRPFESYKKKFPGRRYFMRIWKYGIFDILGKRLSQKKFLSWVLELKLKNWANLKRSKI